MTARCEPLSPALVVGPDHTRPVYLTAVGARRLTDEIRGHLGSAIVKLQQAREGGADEALGYPTWHAYVEAEFGDLRELRLPVVERRALVESMRGDDMSVRAIAGKLGVSVGTVHADLPATRERATVIPLRDPEPDPYAGMTRTDEVVARVRAQGDRGMTCRELELDTGWGHGTASGALSRVARQRRVRHDGRTRMDYGVYIVNEEENA